VPEPARAGLEAALEAAGLLDAWVTPEGVVLDPRTQDVVLVARGARSSSLCDWLVPAENSPVSADRIASILAGIHCSPEDPGDAEAWISIEGRFRLGPAQGAWSKSAAEYIGLAAREAARRRRLEEIASELAVATSDLERIAAELQALGEKQRTLNEEYARAPGDGALRDAHAQFSAAELHRREAQERLAQADAQWNETEDAWRRAREALEQDAEDLRLPVDSNAFASLEPRLDEYAQGAWILVQTALDHRRALSEVTEQELREREAKAQARAALEGRERRVRATDEAVARRDELRATVGAAVAELEHRLTQKAEAVQAGEQRLTQQSAI
jgi:hypothetical protein